MTERKDDRLWAAASNAHRRAIRRVSALLLRSIAACCPTKLAVDRAWPSARPIGIFTATEGKTNPRRSRQIEERREKRSSLAEKTGADAEDVHHFGRKSAPSKN